MQTDFFTSYNRIYSLGKTLKRLVKINHALGYSSNENRPKDSKALLEIWHNANLVLLKSFEQAKEGLLSDLKVFTLKKPVFIPLFIPDIEKTQNEIELAKVIYRFRKDTLSVLAGSPLTKSKKGNKGPTFLVNYQRNHINSNRQISVTTHSLVLKWSQANEIISSKVYYAFLENFYKIKIPEASAFHFKASKYEDNTFNLQCLDLSFCLEIKHIFKELSLLSIREKRIESEDILFISEKVKGENLIDFIRSNYKSLETSQRVELLRNIASLALVDTLYGNTDRFIQIDHITNKHFALEEFEANLGNVVFETNSSNNQITLYSIDNGMDARLLEDEHEQSLYQKFLEDLFSNPNWKILLVDNMKKNLSSALLVAPDDEGDSNVEIIKEELSEFQKDLTNLSTQAFSEGLEEMELHLTSTVIPSIENQRFSSLESYLTEQSPECLNALVKRITTFKITKELT